MAFRSRQLWEILVLARTLGNEIILNCDECFQMLEYLTEATLAENQTVKIRAILQEHIKHCPNCREHHEQKLMEIEMFMEQVKHKTTQPNLGVSPRVIRIYFS